MLDIRRIREDPATVQAALQRRGGAADLGPILEADSRRRSLLTAVEQLKAERNAASEQIAQVKRSGGDASEQIAAMRAVGDRIKALDDQVRQVEQSVERLLLELPNLPDASVPDGQTEEDNVRVREWGAPREFDFEPRPHWEIGVALDIIDFERAARMSGAMFEALKGDGARLRRALIDWMLDVHAREQGYTEISPPLLVNTDSLTASGQLPKFEENLFRVRDLDLWLSPTSEVQLTNLFRDEILEADQLPISVTAHTPCWRWEKVGAGKESRGMIRQYQFDKVEMYKFVAPETSFDKLERLTADAEALYQRLGIPYRLALLCAGDLGFAAAKTYDPMAWFPGVGKWMELSSCSNCLDFQARRANLRYRPAPRAKPQFLHTLNGSGLAVGRTLACVLENSQQADGSVRVPDVLVPYMGGQQFIAPR